MMDGQTYGCFCYLGDPLDGDGGANLAATARIRNGWMKFRELLPFLTSRATPLEIKGRVDAAFPVHLASSSVTLAGHVRKSRGCCSCSPSETYGRKWGDSNFQILTELPVPPQAAGVVGTF